VTPEQRATIAGLLARSWEPIPGPIEMPGDAEHGAVLSRLRRDEWIRAQRPRLGVGPRTAASTARRVGSGASA
jgi:hypothetical protein